MKKLLCDLDCTPIKETFCFTLIEHYKRQITRAIHNTREKMHAGDVLQLYIKNMQGILLQHVWSELLALRNCDVEIILEDLVNEADVIFVLNHVLKNHTHVKIQEIALIKINSIFPEEAGALIKRYSDALLAKNVVTYTFASRDFYVTHENQIAAQKEMKKIVLGVVNKGLYSLHKPAVLPKVEVPASKLCR